MKFHKNLFCFIKSIKNLKFCFKKVIGKLDRKNNSYKKSFFLRSGKKKKNKKFHTF